MQTLTLETEIQPDGLLRFDLPTNLPPGKVDVVLVIQPQAITHPPYPSLEGRWRGLVPTDFDLDGFLHEIRHAWEEEWNGTD